MERNCHQYDVWITAVLAPDFISCSMCSNGQSSYFGRTEMLTTTRGEVWPLHLKQNKMKQCTWKARVYYKFILPSVGCQLKIVTCHLLLQGLGHKPLQSLTFNTARKEFRVEMRNEALCALGETGRRGLQIGRYFQKVL